MWSLVEWSNWLTPENLPRRYDTVFYLCCTEDKLDPSADYEEISSTQVCACVADSCGPTQDCVTPFLLCVCCVVMCTDTAWCNVCVCMYGLFIFYKSVWISLHMTIPYLVEPPLAQILFSKSFLWLPWSHGQCTLPLKDNVNVQMGIYPYLKTIRLYQSFSHCKPNIVKVTFSCNCPNSTVGSQFHFPAAPYNY